MMKAQIQDNRGHFRKNDPLNEWNRKGLKWTHSWYGKHLPKAHVTSPCHSLLRHVRTVLSWKHSHWIPFITSPSPSTLTCTHPTPTLRLLVPTCPAFGHQRGACWCVCYQKSSSLASNPIFLPPPPPPQNTKSLCGPYKQRCVCLMV